MGRKKKNQIWKEEEESDLFVEWEEWELKF